MAIDRQRLVSHLPAIAVGTVEHAGSVELRKTFNTGNFVDHSSRQEQFARGQTLAIIEGHLKVFFSTVYQMASVSHLGLPQCNCSVRSQLLPTKAQELLRINTITR